MLLDKRIFDSVLSAVSDGMHGMLTQSYREREREVDREKRHTDQQQQKKSAWNELK